MQFGTTVTLERDGTRQELSIVGEDEADPTSGVIAWTAPLARAVDGAKVGDVIAFESPARQEEVSILAVRPYLGETRHPRDGSALVAALG